MEKESVGNNVIDCTTCKYGKVNDHLMIPFCYCNDECKNFDKYVPNGNPPKKNDIMPLVCLRCKKDIPLPFSVMESISYTHYSYCEDCLREGLKLLIEKDRETVLEKKLHGKSAEDQIDIILWLMGFAQQYTSSRTAMIEWNKGHIQ